MSKKSGKIAALIEACRGRDLDAHYLGYFACFNHGLFYEAHDVLEELWLADRQGPNYAFHKGLIQLAGAFVHLQKHRLRPAAALFKLAQANLQKYPAVHEHLDVAAVLKLIQSWLHELEVNEFAVNPLVPGSAPGSNCITFDLCATLVHIGHMAATMTKREPQKRERLVARVTTDDKAVITKAAAIAGQSVGSFMVTEARKSALQTIASRERIVLNAKESRRFVEALLAPPRPPTPRMLAAMRAYRATVKSDLD